MTNWACFAECCKTHEVRVLLLLVIRTGRSGQTGPWPAREYAMTSSAMRVGWTGFNSLALHRPRSRVRAKVPMAHRDYFHIAAVNLDCREDCAGPSRAEAIARNNM